ncbi:hypothetical protein ACFLXW_00460 [Candidatus Dependentiae bacterium]
MKRFVLSFVVLLSISFMCNADIKSFLKKIFCCCVRVSEDDGGSVTDLGSDESLQFLEAIGADGTLRQIPTGGATEAELASENVIAAILDRISRAAQSESADD